MLRTRHARHRELISIRNPRVHWFVGAVLTGISGLLLATNAIAEWNAVEFNIPAQPVPSALRVYARQAAVQLLASTQGLDAVKANAVVGRFDSQTALQMLLAGTGLQAQYRADATIVIKRSTEASVPPAGSLDSGALSYSVSQANVEPDRHAVDVENSRTSRNSELQDSKEAVGKLEEIVVTGTQIRGTAPVGASVVTLDREYIEMSGLTTTQEVLQSIPQNFGGGANEDTRAVNIGGGNGNVGFSSSVNLRGLGTESTLVLLNNRRSAAGGGKGNFVDLNSIPVTAIERVEVLPDGASAIYGSDAVGGVINVILRDDYDGAESRLRYAPGTSDIDELQFSQVLGRSWNRGSVLFTYEYYDRSELHSEDRSYTSNSDLTSLGGTDHRNSFSNPGNITRYTGPDGNTTVQLAIPADQDGAALVPSDLLSGVTNLQNTRQGTTVLPKQERQSVFVVLSQELSPSIDLFGDVRYSSREFEHRNSLLQVTRVTVPNSNPFFVDPIGSSTSLRMDYSYVDDYGPSRNSGAVETIAATLGATFSLSNSWELEAYGSYNTEETDSLSDRTPNTLLLAAALADPDPSTAFNPFGDGSTTNPATLAAIEGFTFEKVESELVVFNVRADGDLFDTLGGVAKLAIGGQFREESLSSNSIAFRNTAEPVPGFSIFDVKRDITAAFTELYLPLVSEKNSRTGIKNLAVSIAARYEDYSDFGNTLDPKLGISWWPIDSINVRSTVGTSFRAPLLFETLNANNTAQFGDVTAFTGIPGFANSLFLNGNKPGLEPQEGETWTAGFDLTPSSFPDFKASLTYFDTKVDKVIALPGGSIFDPILDQETFAPILIFPPNIDLATVQTILDSPLCLFCMGVQADELDVVVDFRRSNVGKSELSGVDLDLNYGFDTAAGSFDVSVYASYLLDFKEQIVNGPLVDNIDTITNPVSLTLRSSVAWRYGSINVGAFVNHISDYRNTRKIPVERLSSWTTADLNLGYDFSERFAGFLEGTKVSLSIRNVFDTDPPFVDSRNGFGFDSNNASPLGRFVAVQVIKKWCGVTDC